MVHTILGMIQTEVYEFRQENMVFKTEEHGLKTKEHGFKTKEHKNMRTCEWGEDSLV